MPGEKNLKDVLGLIQDSFDHNLGPELFGLLFTANELEQLIARCAIIKGLVQQEETQRDLAAHLGLSIAKITRGSNELKRMPAKLLTYLDQFFAEDKR